MNMKEDIRKIIPYFSFRGELIDAIPYGSGHINDTYAATFKLKDGKMQRYIVQRINHNVFKKPEELMENISNITKHLRSKIIATGGDPERETLNIVPTCDGGSFLKTGEGNYWRSYIFIEDAKTYDVVENGGHFYAAGKAFGRFQELLSDFPAGNLHETIPDFHHTGKRYDAFIKSVENDAFNRAAEVSEEIEFVTRRSSETRTLVQMLETGKIPLRVTHNDTKFNNVMIDNKTGMGICVIDLDTVMPGSALYDFGDSIRSGANPAAEDEKDLSKVWMELSLYEKFAQGYLESAHSFLTPAELENLPFAAKMMTMECGIRFLTDYLSGDVYFKVHRPGHNLDRARTQFKMVADMENKWDRMHQIVDRYK